MENLQPIFISEDYSAVGRISLPIAQTIMAAFDLPIAAMPTQLFSTQTEGFGPVAALKLGNWQQQAFNHWDSAGLTKFSAGLVGYVGDQATINGVIKFIVQHQIDQLIVDPVMGDQGQYYPGIGNEYLTSMNHLLAQADVMTPNVFELSVLLGEPIIDIKQSIKQIKQRFNHNMQVVVTGINKGQQVGVAYLDNNELKWTGNDRIIGHFYGTGDLFAALLTGYLQSGATFTEAVQLSQSGTYHAVMDTAQQPSSHRKFGMSLPRVMQEVIEFTKNRKEVDQYES